MDGYEEVLLELLKRRFGLRPWMPIVVAEIIGDRVGKALAALKPPVPAPAMPQPATRVLDLKDMLVSRDLTILDVAYGGRLHELVLCSNSGNYSIRFVTDGVARIDRSFQDLQSISPYLDTISAFEDNGKFVLHIKDYSWVSSAYAAVFVGEPVTFHQIFAKYDVFTK
ncbi:MAG: hypothetical protein QXT64_00850 [Desulfurococcaceae archaeon]